MATHLPTYKIMVNMLGLSRD